MKYVSRFSDLHHLLLLATISVLPTAFARAEANFENRAKPNILLIAIDDLNDWIGPLDGHPQTLTPNFDRLALRGVTFLNAHCNIPICSASRSSFMTGLYPEQTGVFTNGNSFFDIDPEIQNLPEHAADNGYITFGAGKLFHSSNEKYQAFFHNYGPGTGNQGGPFTRDELNTLNQNPKHTVDRGPGKLKATLPLNEMPDDRRDGASRNNSFDWGPVDISAAEMPDGQIARWVAEKIDSNHDNPFFMAAGFYRPHQPLFAPREYFENFDPETVQLPETHPEDLDDLPPYAQRLARYPLTAGTHETVVQYGQWKNAIVSYLACVNFIDDQLGLVIDALDQSSAAENTWIVLFSDHGYHLGEKEHWGKFTPWNESTRIPLIIVPPSGYDSKTWAKGVSINDPVSLIDLYPTIIELAAIQSPQHQLGGLSLLSLLKTDRPPHPPTRYAITSIGRGTHSIVRGKYRYIQYFDGTEELYNKQNDPTEFRNLADNSQYAELKADLQTLIPDDPEVAHFIRCEWKKIIIFKDPARAPIVFSITPGTGSGGGVGETNDISGEEQELLEKIRTYLDSNPSAAKRLNLESRVP